MTTIAYLANELPVAVEWYVTEEIRALRERGFCVIPCTGKAVVEDRLPGKMRDLARETVCVRPSSLTQFLRIIYLCLWHGRDLRDLWNRILFEGSEPWHVRLRAIAHTFLGVCCAQQLRHRDVAHIHVHHGYYASWIAMTAARLLGVPFSLTLHGSDLLVDGVYLDTKLRNCAFCLTVSEFNRQHILEHFPSIPSHRVLLHRMGVPIPEATIRTVLRSDPFMLLSVGRLHAVKNHAFLIQACFFLKEYGLPLRCLIAGEGEERHRLEQLIDELGMRDTVQLLGHIPHQQLRSYYEQADLVVLTSHSEGIPLTLMEAMALGRPVLAPAITGIPELIKEGVTGFLYTKGTLEEFVWRVYQISRSLPACAPMARAAREHVREHFNLERNLRSLGELFARRITATTQEEVYEDPVLQQI